MTDSNLQLAANLFASHLHTIDLAIYLVGFVLLVLSFVTWKAIKTAIIERVDTEIRELAEKEREKIKKFIEEKIRKITAEESDSLYKDIEARNGEKEEEM
ncbi:hypothetical protein MNB_SUP05-SYMBIONT-5-149 [hydrothermal vent metagenome]|uniref:Uncharacterized protein n=1 Tax=hydrothermal vent metagenome TaxID=652676 RepID=A0A1W1E1U1_9ZZZZ